MIAFTNTKPDIHNGKGPADALFINASTPRPVAGPGQALVKVRAFGLNRMDLLQREGKYPVPPQAPQTLGGAIVTACNGLP
jgi:NADPH:quinone reductase-like Zn-dependent oxidoreductase